jgi:hypothetical protein
MLQKDGCVQRARRSVHQAAHEPSLTAIDSGDRLRVLCHERRRMFGCSQPQALTWRAGVWEDQRVDTQLPVSARLGRARPAFVRWPGERQHAAPPPPARCAGAESAVEVVARHQTGSIMR